MIHKLTIGHFNIEALKSRRLIPVRPLEIRVVERLLKELGSFDAHGPPRLGGHAVEFKADYIICPWLMPHRIEIAEMFARQIQKETACILYDDGRREIVVLNDMQIDLRNESGCETD